MKRKPLQKLPLLTLLLVVISMATGIFLYTRAWVASGVCAVLGVVLFYRLCRMYDRNARKVAYLFDSIDNGEQAFTYAQEGASGSDRLVDESLNRITRILFQAKLEIVQKEKYYELILNSVNTGIVVIDERGHVLQTNNEALRLLGLTVFTHIRQLSRVDEKLVALFDTAFPGENHQVSYMNEKGTMSMLVRVSGIKLQEKSVRIIAMNDINRELDRKEVDSWIKLTKVLTHEIMNSITPITSLSETLMETYAQENEKIKNGLKVIQSTGNSLISFVESYRKFTHIPPPSPALFYVLAFLERMKQLASLQDRYDNIEVELDIQPGDLLLYADESLISQVVLNLLKNAFEAIGKQKRGIVRVVSYTDLNEMIVMEISNNGPMIPPEVEEQIFVPFFTTKEEGSGIGLSVSKQIMRLSGGSLTCRTNPEETTFCLIFP